MKHELVQLAGKIDSEFIDSEIASLYSDGGRPGIATQFVIGLFLLIRGHSPVDRARRKEAARRSPSPPTVRKAARESPDPLRQRPGVENVTPPAASPA
jgi:hypothetical protein